MALVAKGPFTNLKLSRHSRPLEKAGVRHTYPIIFGDLHLSLARSIGGMYAERGPRAKYCALPVSTLLVALPACVSFALDPSILDVVSLSFTRSTGVARTQP